MKSNLAERIIESCTKNSDKIFIIDASTEMRFSYKDFLKDILHLASVLTSNYSTKKVVILIGTNSYQYSVALCGSIIAGRTLLLINPDEDSDIKQSFIAKVDRAHLILNPEEDLARLLSEPIFSAQTKGPTIEADVFLIPTSATTGISKLVIQRESDILSNIDALIQHHNLLAQPKNIGTPLPLFHVNALHFSFFCSLLTGGTLILYSKFDLRKMLESVATHQIDILSLIPSLLGSIIRQYDSLKKYSLLSLSYFVSAAAPLSQATVQKVHELTGKKIIQGYGLSEGINFTCKLPIAINNDQYKELMIEASIPSIGPCLPGSEIIIRAEDNSICPEAVEGEFTIKGPNFVHGYIGLKDVLDPDGFFASGDLGHYKIVNGAKYFFISGRKKEIAKINGEGVSLRQVEELLTTKEKFNCDFIVTAFENQYRGEELGIVCHFPTLSEEAIKNEIKKIQAAVEAINNNKRPRVLIVQSEHLRTASGKARRWYFKKLFKDFSEDRLLNKLIIKFS